VKRDAAAVGRRGFIGALAAAAASAAAPPSPAGAQPAAALRDGRRALILAGGANRGAYQAGVIGGIVAREGLREGQPLGFDAVCGTSIGAINGYFVATAQYARMRRLWSDVASKNVFALKKRYSRIRLPSSGVGTRAYEAISLGFGLLKNVRGVLDKTAIVDVLNEAIQPESDPVHIPLYISTTNLTQQRGQLFVREGNSPSGRALQAINTRLIDAFAPGAVRVADDGLIRSVLLASASIPIALDPESLPAPDGSSDEYVDGGVTDNVPLEIARRCADSLHAILVDPPPSNADSEYRSAVDIGFGVFETMQRRILEYEFLLAVAETALVPTEVTEAAGLARLPASFFLIEPDSPLPGELGDFADVKSLDAMWQRGYDDGVKGWPPINLAALRGRRTIP